MSSSLRALNPARAVSVVLFLLALTAFAPAPAGQSAAGQTRQRISLNADWKFHRGDPEGDSAVLLYDVRPEARDEKDDKAADTRPTEAVKIVTTQRVLKPWILPTGNDFIKDPAGRHPRPGGDPGGNHPFVQAKFDDGSWQSVNLPHDWAIEGPFHVGDEGVGGGMGRLPSPGVGWYRKRLDIPAGDAGKSIFLDVDRKSVV
jgi:beta-galactosidase